jgi:hypothetical protein
MEFKELKIEQEGSWFKRTLKSRQLRRSITAIVIGALLGFLYFYFTEGKQQDVLLTGQILKSMAIGGFFGLFITNSPCARGRC